MSPTSSRSGLFSAASDSARLQRAFVKAHGEVSQLRLAEVERRPVLPWSKSRPNLRKSPPEDVLSAVPAWAEAVADTTEPYALVGVLADHGEQAVRYYTQIKNKLSIRQRGRVRS
jgi:hypothetical protein